MREGHVIGGMWLDWSVASPLFRFVPAQVKPGETLDPAQQSVADHAGGPLLVRGGPGTGKTEALVGAAVQRVRAGVDPRRVLVLGLRRHDTAYLRDRINSELASESASEVEVHTFSAFALAVLQRQARQENRRPPRLLSGPEQESLIRDMLSAQDFDWPDHLRPAVATYAFTQQLRDVVLRCGERGISAPYLARLGQSQERPEWIAAAGFLDAYVSTLAAMSLEGDLLDSAELVRIATARLRDFPAASGSPSWVFVDDLQDATPAHVSLLRSVCGRGSNLVAAACPDVSVFGYQGAEPEMVRDFPYDFVTADGSPAPIAQLSSVPLASPAVVSATNTLANRLRGSARDRSRLSAQEASVPDAVRVVHLPSPTQEASLVADELRRAHLLSGVRYGDMAVITRSARTLPDIRRALHHASVPVRQVADDVPLTSQPVVRDLLRLIQCGRDRGLIDAAAAEALLLSPYAGADPSLLRRLKLELRRFAMSQDVFRPAAELVADLLADSEEGLPLPDEEWALPARRLRELLDVAEQSDGSITDTLWAVWDRSGLADRLQRLALSSDRRSPRADADLDAMVALFDMAGDYTENRPGSSVEVFCTHVLSQQLPGDSLSERSQVASAVTLTTAHAAHGQFWDLVVVCGANEGTWPNLRPRGSVMGAEALVELESGRQGVDVIAQLLDEERRLFYVASTRTRQRLLVTGVDSDDAQPSRFTVELGVSPESLRGLPPGLNLATLTAQLRRAAVDEEDADAVALLAGLAEEGVPGADPSEWWGLAQLSDSRGLHWHNDIVRLSPSKAEKVQQCGLRWILETHGGDEVADLPRLVGTLLHGAAEEVAKRPDAPAREVVDAVVEEHFAQLPFEAPWQVLQQREQMQGTADRLASWLEAHRSQLLAAEQSFRVRIEVGEQGQPVIISGQADRLERSADGVYVVDIKTGKNFLTAAEAEANAQLGIYQLAVAEDGFVEVAGPGAQPAGAELVYPAKDSQKVTTRTQSALSAAENPDWARDLVADVAEQMAADSFTARHTSQCRTCSVKNCCPLTNEGKQVTDE